MGASDPRQIFYLSPCVLGKNELDKGRLYEQRQLQTFHSTCSQVSHRVCKHQTAFLRQAVKEPIRSKFRNQHLRLSDPLSKSKHSNPSITAGNKFIDSVTVPEPAAQHRNPTRTDKDCNAIP